MRTVDNVIIGAGLAGLVSERFLRDQDTVLLDERPFGYKIGESLIPEVFRHPELAALLPAIRALPSYTQKWGTTFVGPEAAVGFPLEESEAVRSMHLVRHEMEELMADAWSTPITAARVTGVDLDARVVETTQGPIRYRNALVDCSGPAMVVASLLGEVESVHPVHARWGYWDIQASDDEAFEAWIGARGAELRRYDPRHNEPVPSDGAGVWPAAETTILHRASDGVWCWQIPLYGGTVLSFGVVSRHGPVSEEDYERVTRSELAGCYKATRRAGGDGPLQQTHVRDGFARRAKRAGGEGFVLLSDAFAFSDPVYSVGTAFAVNQAIEVASRLREGPWTAELAAAYNQHAAHLHDRACRAFELWYDGRVMHDREADAEVRDVMLRGGLFRAGVAEAYGAVLNDSDLAGHKSPFQPKAGAVPITSAVAALFEGLSADWCVGEAMPTSHGVRVAMSAAGVDELHVLVHRNDGTRNGRELGALALSYRATERTPPGPVIDGLFDQLAAVVRPREEEWNSLLARTS